MMSNIGKGRNFAKLNTLVLIGVAAALTACQEVNGGVGPVVWNKEARLGEHVALPISTNAVPNEFNFDDPNGASQGTNVFKLSKENVLVRLKTSPTSYRFITPDAVIENSISRASPYANTYPGAWMALVVFQVPADLSVSFPATVPLRFLVDGQLNGNVSTSLTIVGSGGDPTSFSPSLAELENPPMLRLRARIGGGALPTDCEIGSMQFDLSYSSAVTSPDAFVNSEAFRGTVTLASTGSGTARVVLIAPDGFVVPDDDGNGFGGLGPLIDIAFTKLAPFDASHFQIQNLIVTTPDGDTCVDQSNQTSTQAFQLTVIRG